jgi:hypothetical protein
MLTGQCQGWRNRGRKVVLGDQPVAISLRYSLSPTAQREARLRAILESDLLVLDDLFVSRAGALLLHGVGEFAQP